MTNRIYDIINAEPNAETLWDGAHKIPWNAPEFSARILREHLSQDHHLASRKAEIIHAQTQWIAANILTTQAASILDLGCGPGLYSRELAGETNSYSGIDFSPASIGHAQQEYTIPGRCEFTLGDVTKAEFGSSHDIVMMLYGELNVFSPANCQRILRKAHEALSHGGTLLIEYQNPTAVKGMGEAPNTWTKAKQGGLFASVPYVCLTENYWFDKEETALQCFHVVTDADRESAHYRSTTKAWEFRELKTMLTGIGFTDVTRHEDWPVPDDSLQLLSARK